MLEPLTVGATGVVTAIGVVLLLFGVEIAKPLLSAGGALAGAIAGGGIGVTVLPSLGGVAGETQAVAVIGGILVGAVLGYTFVPLVGRLATAVAGFAGTALATTVVLTGEDVLDAVFDAVGAGPTEAMGTLHESVFAQVALQETLAVAVGVGLIGGLLALRYYASIVALVAMGAGAALLGVVMPLWSTLIEQGTVDPTVSEFSVIWFGVAFAIGVVFQASRHIDVLSN